MPVTSTPTPTPTGGASGFSQAQQQYLAGLISATQGGGTQGPDQVYLGSAYNVYGPGGFKGGQAYTGGPQVKYDQNGRPISQPNNQPNQAPVWASLSDAKMAFGNFSQKQVSDWVAQGVLAGMLKPGDGWLQGQQLWDQMVEVAARQGANGNQISPFDVLRSYITQQNTAGVWVKDKNGLFETNSITGARRYVGPQFRTTTSTAVNLMDPNTAKALATSVFQQLLGRDPMPGELNNYASALTAAEQANPTVINTTNQYDSLGNVIATTKQDQRGGYGVDAAKFLAEQQAKANPEYGATQAATTYENAFENAVFGQAR